MNVLVCGGRDYNEIEDINTALNMLPTTPSIIIQGGAKGADNWAAVWAMHKGVHVAEVKALWEYYGKSAGFKRNSAMLLLKPDYCVAFPGGRGTQSMVDLCKLNGVTVWQPYG
jgi:hypothetical protein